MFFFSVIGAIQMRYDDDDDDETVEDRWVHAARRLTNFSCCLVTCDSKAH